MDNGKLEKLKNEIQRKKDIKKFLGVLSQVQKSLEDVKKEIKEKKDPFDEVKVNNFPEQRKSVKVENLNEIEIPKEVSVNNLKEIKIPDHPEEINIVKPKWFSLKSVTDSLKEIKQSIININIPSFDKHTKKKNALAVRLVDRDGNEYYTAGGGGNGGGNTNQQLIENINDNHTELYSKIPITAFGDLRTAELTPLIQFSFEYTVDNTALNTKIISNGGTITQADAMAVANTSATTGSLARLICNQHARYRAGLGGLMRFTAMFTTGVAGTSQWAGILGAGGSTADIIDGFAVGYNGDTFGVARFQNDSLNFTSLADCDDPLDGTGASGITLDPTKLNVYYIDYQYLGAGAITFSVSDPNGNMHTFHTIKYSNQNTVPSVYNPNFHLSIYANNKATTADLTVKSASMAYFVEGKTEQIETHQYTQSSGAKEKTSVTTEVPIFTIRNKSTYASKSNFISILLERLSASIQASSPQNLGRVRIVKNATLSGTPSWSDINTNNSVVEIDTSASGLSGGTELTSSLLAGQNDKATEDLIDYHLFLHAGETITVAGRSANSATIDASLMWRELF